MKKYIEYKNEVDGFKDVSLTVKTVEKISASYIHFLKVMTNNLYNYNQTIEKVLGRLLQFHKLADNIFLKQKKSNRKLLVFLSGDKGLVGGLYHNLANILSDHNEKYDYLIVIGKKGERYIKEEGFKILKSFYFTDYLPTPKEIQEICDYILGQFKNKNFSKIDILYPAFISLSVHQPKFIRFLPFPFVDNSQVESRPAIGLPIFASSPKKIFDDLFTKYIKTFFARVVLESKLSEFSARTVAMEHAAVKTQEILEKIKLDYFKERKRIITQKQLESFSVHRLRK